MFDYFILELLLDSYEEFIYSLLNVNLVSSSFYLI